MSRLLPILLIRKIVEQGYTTIQIEEYFNKKWSSLQQELFEFLKGEPDEDEKFKEIFHLLQENDAKINRER